MFFFSLLPLLFFFRQAALTLMKNADVNFSNSQKRIEQKSDPNFESKSNQSDLNINEVTSNPNFTNAQRQKLMNIITTALRLQQQNKIRQI